MQQYFQFQKDALLAIDSKIAELYGTPAAFLLPAACFAVVALYGWKGARAAPPADPST